MNYSCHVCILLIIDIALFTTDSLFTNIYDSTLETLKYIRWIIHEEHELFMVHGKVKIIKVPLAIEEEKKKKTNYINFFRKVAFTETCAIFYLLKWEVYKNE